MWRNTEQGYGLLAIVLHWLMAVLFLVLFALGIWMVTLGYYDQWYNRGPYIHRSLGAIFFTLLLLRFGWRLANPRPQFEASVAAWEASLALLVQWLFYCLLLLIPISGYLMTTARGSAVPVFDWFRIPATLRLPDHVDMLGNIHLYLSWLTVGLIVLHVVGALKHHFFDKNKTLVKMLMPVNNDRGKNHD